MYILMNLEREFMYFTGKLVYLIVLASVQLDVNEEKELHLLQLMLACKIYEFFEILTLF